MKGRCAAVTRVAGGSGKSDRKIVAEETKWQEWQGRGAAVAKVTGRKKEKRA